MKMILVYDGFVTIFQACASNPHDPYHGGMMAAYGQPLVRSRSEFISQSESFFR